MEESELVDQLSRFGVGERAARVFYHLSRLGPSTASEIAEATSVQRTQVYQVMDDLEEEGFVDRTLERPRRYVPRPVSEVLNEALEERRREVAQLEDASEELVDRWPRLEHDDDARRQRFSVHDGRRQVGGLLERMLEDAEEEILVVATRRGLARMDGMGAVEEMLRAADEGVDLRVLTPMGEPERGREVMDRVGEAAQLRHTELPGYAQFVIVDADQVALFVAMDAMVSTSEGNETVLWLNARDFILSQVALFDQLWTTGVPHEARVRELEDGEPAGRVEVVRGRWMRYNRAKEMLRRAEERVRFSVPDAEHERVFESGVAQELERAADRGLEVTVLANAPLDIEGVETRQTDLVDGLAILLVDDQEGLVGMGVDEVPEAMASSSEWAVWATMSSFVDHLGRELDALSPGARAVAADQ